MTVFRLSCRASLTVSTSRKWMRRRRSYLDKNRPTTVAPHPSYGHPLTHTRRFSISDFPKGRGRSYLLSLYGTKQYDDLKSTLIRNTNFSFTPWGEDVRRTGEGLLVLLFGLLLFSSCNTDDFEFEKRYVFWIILHGVARLERWCKEYQYTALQPKDGKCAYHYRD